MASYAEDLKTLVDKAYPDLQDAAREQIALTQFLLQIDNPQVAFAVRQQKPTTLDAAVTATLEMESYWNPKLDIAGVEAEVTPPTPAMGPTSDAVSAVIPSARKQDSTQDLMKAFLDRMEKIEVELASSRSNGSRGEMLGRGNRQVQVQGPPRAVGRRPIGTVGRKAETAPSSRETSDLLHEGPNAEGRYRKGS